jgi:Domain of unknown function (DUF5127)/Domain of unknown function (DUF4965)/Domain of unknown function (DUF1793)/Ricin-type beta-trefoil lectin domain-like/Domain of unknown function (DUF4964)/TAT (twin-arginine translocation) pathway signal sequence
VSLPEDRDRATSVPATPPSRRDVLRWGGVATAAAVTATWLSTGPAAAAPRQSVVPAASTFSPLRPPATPLAVRSMYLTTWLPGDNLAGTWPTFWNGRVTALCGIARIDGTPYLFAGAPSLPSGPALTTMTQTSLQMTATRSTYTLTGGGVTLTVSFLSPVDLGNLQRQSVPLSYVTVQAAANDGGSHTVSVYLDASAEWVHGDSTAQVTWAQQKTATMTALTCQPASPGVLQEHGDQASWGSLVFAAPTSGNLSWQTGQDTTVRAGFAGSGSLPNTDDTAQPRAIDDRWPVFALAQNLGTVSGTPSATLQVSLGHVRTPAVSYLGTNLNPWWTNYWSSWTDMLEWFNGDYASAASSAGALDTKIHNDASAAVGGGTTGDHYAAVCALALRQAVGGTELINRGGTAWAFLKEISSDGNVSTIDVTYPAFPAYLYLSPAYLQLLLEPALEYAETGGWPKTFAEHDLGSSYPNAAGHNDGNEEDMPVEESANMLIMTAAVVQRLSSAQASSFASAHYTILHQWAEYLVGNALDPGLQNQTDDFTGFIAHSVNLALKGIIGIGAMSVIAKAAGNTSDAAHYLAVARGYISQWVSMGLDSSGQHMKLAYDQDGTWSLKYNGFPDRLLGLNLVPTGVATMEAAWYSAQAGAYGVLLDPRNNYTKTDWEMWTAGWLADHGSTRDMLVNGVYGFANTTPQRVPFSDWYVVASGAQQGFADRPVIGGVFPLLLGAGPAAVTWNKIQNKNSGKLLAVTDQSLADSANVTQYSDNGTNDHLWTVVDNGDGTVKIYNRNSGKLLAVNNQSTADGALVQQYNDNGTQDHLWKFVDNGDGYMKIVNVHSNKVLAVDQASTADSAQVTQYTDNGTSDHLWRLV